VPLPRYNTTTLEGKRKRITLDAISEATTNPADSTGTIEVLLEEKKSRTCGRELSTAHTPHREAESCTSLWTASLRIPMAVIVGDGEGQVALPARRDYIEELIERFPGFAGHLKPPRSSPRSLVVSSRRWGLRGGNY
jgi:hypothetical protein